MTRSTLLAWNGAMALFHGVLALVTLVLGNRSLDVQVYKTALDFRYTTNDTSRGAPWELVPISVASGSLSVTWWVASFFLLSMLFHLLNATLLREYYLSRLGRCLTPTRWIEYSLSAPVMIVVISYTLGVRDRAVLIANAVLVAVTMAFGLWTELAARPASCDEWQQPLRMRLLPWTIGHLPLVGAWLLILLQFYDGALTSEDRAPAFVHAILWGELLLFFSFGGAALLSQVRPPRYFYQGELAFQVLSLVSKGLLGGLLLANVLVLSRFEEIYDKDAA